VNIRSTGETLSSPAITPALVLAARTMSLQSDRPVLDLLADSAGITTSEIARLLASQLGFQFFGAPEIYALKHDFEVISYAEANARRCISLRREDGRLWIVCDDPWNSLLRNWVEDMVVEPFVWVLIEPALLTDLLVIGERALKALTTLVADENVQGVQGRHQSDAEDISLIRISEDSSPILRFVNSTLYDALKSGASDIHFEMTGIGLTVKYRLDGVLVSADAPRVTDAAEQVISRLKVMAELDIAERRVPQDGRFRVSINRRDVDFRVSIMPSIHGEDAVLRILDKHGLVDDRGGLHVEALGIDGDSRVVVRKLAREPYGMLLVTGPTGSGKTTTLYAVINEINDGRDKIVTIEDPVEYQLNGVLQIPVNERKGLTFARGLRSILRHDPDKILVGEIRDSETAQIAVQAALTGHQVFTTVHANNVFDVIGRFIHMQVEPYSFVSALNGIMAQRLVRVNCPNCVTDFVPDNTLISESGLSTAGLIGFRFRKGTGCAQCRGTGFKGRKAIAEVLVLNETIRELIVARSPFRELRLAAQASGTVFLREQALSLVKNGETTLDEINRVTLVS
jgi:general secretion pathway protein E